MKAFSFSVERCDYAPAELLLRLSLRLCESRAQAPRSQLLIGCPSGAYCFSPLLSCTSRPALAPERVWRGAFPVPVELASDPRALFSLERSDGLVLALPRPVILGIDGLPVPATSGADGVIARTWPYALKRGALLVAVTCQLSLLPASNPAGALANGTSQSGPGGASVRALAATSVTEATTTTTTQQVATEGEAESPSSTTTSPHEAPSPEQAASTTTSSTPQSVTPDTEPAPPPNARGASAPGPAQPKGSQAAPAPSRKTHRDANGGTAAPSRPAVAEPQDEPVAPPANSAEAGVLSPQLAELTRLLDGAEEVPPPYLIPIYEAAGNRYDVPWRVLAAINAVETDYGRDLSVSPAGAVGWMQFMPETWARWAVDADHDGEKNPYSRQDAIFTAARYLQASGAEHDLAGAIFAYNHAAWYVTEVLLRARLLSNVASFADVERGYALPLERRYMNALGRTDDGVDIETAPDGALVYSITPGVVTAVASDAGGFGPNYPVVRATAGTLAGQNIYYGHVAASLVHPGEIVAAGQPIAIMGHTGDAASLGHGHIEIGFSDAGGDPLSHHGAGAWTPAGDLMRAFLVALSSSFGVHNE